MVTIISQLSYESSTNHVIDWLDFIGSRWQRINGVDILKDFKLELGNSKDNFKFKDLVDNSDVIWFRRWLSQDCYNEFFVSNNEENNISFSVDINNFLAADVETISEFCFAIIPNSLKFNCINLREINKLSVLLKAKELGLRIPKSFIFNSKLDLANEINKNKCISKTISGQATFYYKNQFFNGYTSDLELQDIKGKTFFPSFGQEKIIKKFEIRSFYVSGNIYSMAIFSQANSKTSLDFRMYDKENPNRTVPFNLPTKTEKKLIILAKYYQLNCCSFDIIYNDSKEYILLEVNPGGQFGMTSFPCNFNLEKKIAISLENTIWKKN